MGQRWSYPPTGQRSAPSWDRNGLRPCRYLVTKDGLLVMASETGVLDVPDESVLYKWRIQPGRMFLLDTEEGRIVEDEEIKAELAGQQPYWPMASGQQSEHGRAA